MKRPAVLGAGLMAITFSLLFTACSSGPASSPTSPVASQTQPAGTVAESTGQDVGASTPARMGNKNDVLDNGGYPEFTWEDHVASMRKMSNLTSWPEVERIRYVSMEEYSTLQAQCFTEAGFPSTVENDGTSFSTSNAEGQEEAFALVSYTCSLQYPMDLRYAQALTRTQLRVIYAYYRDQLIPCLQGRGLEISPLPSEETFVEGVASGTNPWTPYNDMPVENLDTDAMNKDCPPMPSSELLYGS